MFRSMFFVCLTVLIASTAQSAIAQPHFASGIKIGEVDQHQAIVWVRLTTRKSADFDRLPDVSKPENRSVLMPDEDLVPGTAGVVRVAYWPADDTESKRHTDWKSVTSENDFIHQFRLESLRPGTRYILEIEAKSAAESEQVNRIAGEFQTAPDANDAQPIRFIVTTCQAVRSIDDSPVGHQTYRHMLAFKPQFFVHTGDILYYDKLPLAKNPAQARSKWHLMFAFDANREFHRHVSSYFMKDDHDTLKNDCWPGQKYGELTFEQGLQIFRQQVPMNERTYRTIRWGQDVQIWLTEHRDFRSSNRMPDGPEKTILGDQQKQWLKKTISDSDATYKFVITPGPIVGPDKKGKNDNHSNPGFATEGQELRDFLSAQKNLFVICGDRHWQYCSRDPQTGLLEFGCGPINDQHMFGGNPGKQPDYHRYFSARGGFLGVTVDGDQAKAEWFGTDRLKAGQQVEVLHREDLGKPE